MRRRRRPTGAPKRAPSVSQAEREAWALRCPQKAAQGYFMDAQGYIARMVRVNGKRRYLREHREVAERMLGRPLVKGENCHHLNGDRTDNRPENIEIWSTSQPSGQRIEDKLAWAYELIALHDPDGTFRPEPLA